VLRCGFTTISTSCPRDITVTVHSGISTSPGVEAKRGSRFRGNDGVKWRALLPAIAGMTEFGTVHGSLYPLITRAMLPHRAVGPQTVTPAKAGAPLRWQRAWPSRRYFRAGRASQGSWPRSVRSSTPGSIS
jgi:hypothetical protein